MAGPLRGPAWTAWSPSASTGCTRPDRRAWRKVKHTRTADCVVAGYRLHKRGPDLVGSLLLGLYTDDGELAMAGVIGAFPMVRRQELFAELQPLRAFEGHPGTGAPGCGRPRPPAAPGGGQQQPLEPGQAVVRAPAARAGGRGPLRPGGPPLQHTAQFQRWRPDRDPRSCTYDQLEEAVGYDLADVLATPRPDRRPQVTSTDPNSGRPVGRCTEIVTPEGVVRDSSSARPVAMPRSRRGAGRRRRSPGTPAG